MQPRKENVLGIDRHTHGPVSLVQGVYGARGNLELVACDADTGIWVFWYNADLPSDPPAAPDVPPGAWSAGLLFGLGRRYVDAVILQSTLGPDHLEVLALDSEGALWSWYWSPGPGFQCREKPVASGISRFEAGHDAGTVRVTLVDRGGETRHVASGPTGYPDRSWAGASTGPSLRTEADVLRLLAEVGIDARDVAPGTVRAARSTRGGGSAEITWRDGAGDICHITVPAA